MNNPGYPYFNAWVVLGAHRLGQLDVSGRGFDFVLGFQDEETGGFYSSRLERGPEARQEIMVVSMCGLACLQTGKMVPARRAGAWLRRVLEAQPDFPNRLYTGHSSRHGLYTNPEAGEDFRYLVVAGARRDQAFFNPGIAAAFLSRLFQATAESLWLDLAKKIPAFC